MILLIDGNNLANRYAFVQTTPEKAEGHALKRIMELVKQTHADGVIVIWDGGSEKRKAIYPEYKLREIKIKDGESEEEVAKKEEEAESIRKRVQDFIDHIQDAFKFAGLIQCRVNGEEADDVIASMVRSIFVDEVITICSNDQDFYTLLSPTVSIYNWKEHITLATFTDKYKLSPTDWPKVRSLTGDSADNIPGIKGIGPVKGSKIVRDGDYAKYAGLPEVALYLKVMEFRKLSEEAISRALEIGSFNRIMLYNICEISSTGISIVDDIIRLNRKSKMRRWKTGIHKGDMATCRACALVLKAQNFVSFHGEPDSDIMLIGEAPGETEDSTGIPFVGDAGRKLDEWLKVIDLERDRILITNVVWHRPVGKDGKNAKPKPKEIDACTTRGLEPLIKMIMPKFVIALGGYAANFMVNNKLAVTKDYGKYVVERFGFPIDMWVIPHPASLLYSNASEDTINDQLPAIKKFIDESGLRDKWEF